MSPGRDGGMEGRRGEERGKGGGRKGEEERMMRKGKSPL